jgi:Protein of unknown function (DUF1329)
MPSSMLRCLFAAAAALAWAATAGAGPSEEQIARLGKDLTPVGAERAGNADGTIPAWTGGVTTAPAGWKPGDTRPDLFADDKVLFTIDASNVDRYADRLAAGQIALIKRYDGYRMNVYKTHRSCALPEEYYEAAKQNARTASVDEQCFLEGGIREPLFPLPQNGCEAIWNGSRARFEGQVGADKVAVQAIVTRGGDYYLSRTQERQYFKIYDPKIKTFDGLEGWATKTIALTLSPAKQAGEITLVNVTIDGHLNTWLYNPGQRRVRRAPNFVYDNPVPAWDGLVNIDQVNGYVPPMDRYQWKLLGKKEMYIPYDAARIRSKNLKYSEIIGPRYPQRDLLRYELHRVWVVEADLRPDQRHMMPKRVFYMDEDTWAIVHSDNYDKHGELFRISEHHPEVIWELPSCLPTTSFYYDLPSGRYVAADLQNEEPEEDYLAGNKGLVTDDGFTPDAMRRMGRR